MSNSVRPHRRQPTRLPCPWDSPGKNTGVGCHFLLQCMKVKSESEVAQSCLTLSHPMDCSLPGFFIHGIFQARVLEWGAIAFSGFHTYQHPYPWVGFFQANSCNLLWLLRYWDESSCNLTEACKTFACWDLPSYCWQLVYHHVIKLGLAS